MDEQEKQELRAEGYRVKVYWNSYAIEHHGKLVRSPKANQFGLYFYEAGDAWRAIRDC